jgi:hypothetical protein
MYSREFTSSIKIHHLKYYQQLYEKWKGYKSKILITFNPNIKTIFSLFLIAVIMTIAVAEIVNVSDVYTK